MWEHKFNFPFIIKKNRAILYLNFNGPPAKALLPKDSTFCRDDWLHFKDKNGNIIIKVPRFMFRNYFVCLKLVNNRSSIGNLHNEFGF